MEIGWEMQWCQGQLRLKDHIWQPNPQYGMGLLRQMLEEARVRQSNPQYGMGLLRQMLEEAKVQLLWKKVAEHRHGGYGKWVGSHPHNQPEGIITVHHVTTSGGFSHRLTPPPLLAHNGVHVAWGAGSDLSHWAGEVTIYTDGSGGTRSADPRLRRCGWAW
eukprot:554909-Karenia_brevis.AAC.1